MRLLYLHGFASGPQSSKAQAFKAALPALEIPALDGGDFEHLTISGQLAIVEETLHGEPALLIGSSMGGYIAALYASRHPEVSRMALLAPAFAFAPRWNGQWPGQASLDVFHHGTQTIRRVDRGLIDDALRYPSVPDFPQPALILHGVNDDVVPIDYSRAFAAAHPNARLVELESGHELLDVLEWIVAESVPFLLQR